MALLKGRLDAAEAFAASQLDESFQIEAWGEDKEQTQRHAARSPEIAVAARLASLLRSELVRRTRTPRPQLSRAQAA